MELYPYMPHKVNSMTSCYCVIMKFVPKTYKGPIKHLTSTFFESTKRQHNCNLKKKNLFLNFRTIDEYRTYNSSFFYEFKTTTTQTIAVVLKVGSQPT